METEKEKLYLEDLCVGQKFLSGTHTLTEEEIIAFAQLYDPQPFHTDKEAAKETFFQGLAASGWQTASLTMGLLVRGGIPLGGGLIGAGAEISWPRPTRAGETLQVESEVLEIKESRSRPERGIVKVRSTTRNASGETLQILTSNMVVFKRNS